jgi:putative ABC transport system permease protein
MIRPGVRRLFRLPLRRPEVAEREMEEEIRLHLEMRVAELERRGMSPAAARAEALRRFGVGRGERRELGRAARLRERRLGVREWLDGARQDVRVSLRSLARTPGVTSVIVLTLALGIGLCTSIHAVVRGVILHPAPFPEPRQLFSVELASEGGAALPLLEDFEVWRAQAAPAAELAAYAIGANRVGSGEATVEAFSVRVSEEFFAALRPRAHLGRALLPADASHSDEPGVVISHRLWRDLLGGDPGAIGRPLRVGGRTYALAGVLEPGQEFPAAVDVWTPLAGPPADRASLRVTVIGRLRAGATSDGARAAVEAAQRAVALERGGEETAARAQILPLTGRQNEAVGVAVFLLALSVGSILLIGIVNAGGLILTRAVARSREIAIRAALGASRLRISTLLLMEALLVSLAAAAVGLLVGHLALAGFARAVPEAVTRQMLGWEQLGLDAHAVAFAIALALIAGVGCTLIPALGAARPDLAGALQQGTGNATPPPRRQRLMRAVVVGEVALSVALLLCAALLTRSLVTLAGDETGFATDGIATLRWSAGPAEGEPTADPGDALLRRFASAEGVSSVALTSDLPATRAGFGATRAFELERPGRPASAGRAGWRAVSPGYLETVRIPLLQGRTISEADGAGSPRVAVVSAALATARGRRVEEVLGNRITIGEVEWTVVGVVADVRGSGPGASAEPVVYVPHEQAPARGGYLVARLAGPIGAAEGALREAAWSVDPEIALGRVRPLRTVVDEMTADQRIVATLVGAYALTALIITLISLYAIVAHLVVRHRREHAIRAAMGATPWQILRGAMRRALGAAAAGTLLGTALAAGLARLIAGLLHGVTPLEPSVFGIVPLVLVALFAVAVWLPARAAARVPPATALRS